MYRTFSHPNPTVHYKYIAIVITLCLLSNCPTSVATHEKVDEADPIATGDVLREAEALFSLRADVKNLRKAVTILGRVRDPDNRNFEIEWKFAKYSYFLAKSEVGQEKSIEGYEKGRDAARVAMRLGQEKPDGHFWYAANLGELARISPLTVGRKSVDELRGSLEKVIAIDPGYQGASAFDALGQLEMATRNFKGGKAERAVEYYLKGLALAPDNANLQLHLAEAFLALKRDTDARKHLDTLISIKPDQEYALEHELAVIKAKELLSKNF